MLALVLGGLWGVWHFGTWNVLDWFSNSKPLEAGAMVEQVREGDLVITITEDGTLQSSSNLDIKCEVTGGTTILWLVQDGSHVDEGDELVRLDSSLIEEQVNTQKIAYERAQATRIEAERLFSASKIAVQEYIEGTYLQQMQTIEANITIAMENLRSAENTYYYTERMARKGYVASLQRESQAFAVERSKLDLANARTAKEVLEKFTRAKTVEDLESKRDTAEAKMRSEQAAFELEEGKLKRLTNQLEKCTIRAPRAGMVIYANDQPRFGSQAVSIEEGAAVRQSQSILRLPDLDHMEVKTLVHESKVERLRLGMRARVRVQGVDYQGTISYIANQAEAANFLAANVKDFSTIVKIDDEEIPHDGEHQLRPGMTASVEILVAHIPNALSVPIMSVREMGSHSFCWVKEGNRVVRREVEVGQNNDKVIEIKTGLTAQDWVLLNPAPYASDLAIEFKAKGETIDVKQRYGDAPEKPKKDPAARSGGAANGAAPGGGAPGGGGSGGGRNRNIMQFDKDGDGKVSREEAPEEMARFFDRVDENQDGFIDRKEAAAAAARRKQREAEAGGGAGAGGGGSGPRAAPSSWRPIPPE